MIKKQLYSGQGIAFDWKIEWSFGNAFCRNVAIFGFDNSPSSHIDNCKNNFLILGEGKYFC